MRGFSALPSMPQLQTSASFLVNAISNQTLGSTGVSAYCALALRVYRLISPGEITQFREKAFTANIGCSTRMPSQRSFT